MSKNFLAYKLYNGLFRCYNVGMEAKELIKEKIEKIDYISLQREYLADSTNFVYRHIASNEDLQQLTNIEDLLYNLYSDWYYNVCLSVNEEVTNRVACFPKSINPSMTEENIIEFLENLPDVRLKYPISIFDSFNAKRVKIDTRIVQADYSTTSTYECFIALKMPVTFVDSFLREVIYRTGKEKIYPVLEFGLDNSRLDNVIIYTDCNSVLKLIDIIYQIKDFLPGLFTDVVAKCDLLNTLEVFMGYGEIDTPSIDMYYKNLVSSFDANIKDCACSKLHDMLLSNDKLPSYSSSICTGSLSTHLYATLAIDIISELNKNINLLQRLSGRSQSEEEYLQNLITLLDKVKAHSLDDQINDACVAIRKGYTTYNFSKVPIKLTDGDFNITLHIPTDYVDPLFDLITPVKHKLHYTRIEKTRAVNTAMYPHFANRIIARYKGTEMTDYEVVAYIIKKCLIESLTTSIDNCSDSIDVASLKSILQKIQDDSDEGREIIHDYILDYTRALLDHDHTNLCITLLNKFPIRINLDMDKTMIALFDNLKQQIDQSIDATHEKQETYIQMEM